MRTIFFLGAFLLASFHQKETFEKKEWPESHLSLLVSRDWHIFFEKIGDFPICYLSPEVMDPSSGNYEVGLAIHVLRKIPALMGQKPSEYVNSLIHQIRERSDGEVLVETTQSSSFKIYRVEYSFFGEKEAMNVINIFQANDKTGTLYMMVWQTPESQASLFSEVREKMFTSIELDPTF